MALFWPIVKANTRDITKKLNVKKKPDFGAFLAYRKKRILGYIIEKKQKNRTKIGAFLAEIQDHVWKWLVGDDGMTTVMLIMGGGGTVQPSWDPQIRHRYRYPDASRLPPAAPWPLFRIRSYTRNKSYSQN